MSMKKITCKIKGQKVEFIYNVTRAQEARKVAAEKYGVKETQVTSVKLSKSAQFKFEI